MAYIGKDSVYLASLSCHEGGLMFNVGEANVDE